MAFHRGKKSEIQLLSSLASCKEQLIESNYETNKAGYTAVRCVPLVMPLLASSFVALPSSPPSAPSPSPHHPLPLSIYPSQNTRFCVLEKTGYWPTNGRTDRRTDRPSCRDAKTHLKIVIILLMIENTRKIGLTRNSFESIWWEQNPLFIHLFLCRTLVTNLWKIGRGRGRSDSWWIFCCFRTRASPPS